MFIKKYTSFFSREKILFLFLLSWFSFYLFFPSPCFARITEKELKGTLLPAVVDGYSFWEQGSFIIRFMREGENAVPPFDSNNNGCPDSIENIALQLVAAQHIFCDIAGYPNPLGSTFYPDAQKVYVLVASKKKLGGANGLAFDSVSHYPDLRSTKTPRPKIGGLAIRISKDTDPIKGRIPMHEYFHLIQNSMNHFKNAWYYEGMASWAQMMAYPFPHKSNTKFTPEEAMARLMNDPKYKNHLITESYSTVKTLWNPLSTMCPEASLSLPEDDLFLGVTYLDGSPIVKKTALNGILLMRRVLERLGESDSAPFTLYNYQKWDAKTRRLGTNNSYIIDAIVQAYGDICPSTH